MGQGGGPASKGEPARHAPLRTSPLTDCGMGPQPGSGRVPEVPGSSTDPPPGCFLRRALGPAPGDRSPGRRGQQVAGCVWMEGTQDGLRARASTAPPPGGGAGTRPGVDEFSEDEDFPPLLSVIPDLFVPIPRRGGPQAPPPPGWKGYGAAGA